jgi:hypothetical protein
MMPLPDVYCLFNRARGAELISPDDLLTAVKLLPTIGAQLNFRQFASGVLVVQSAAHSDEKVSAVRCLVMEYDCKKARLCVPPCKASLQAAYQSLPVSAPMARLPGLHRVGAKGGVGADAMSGLSAGAPAASRADRLLRSW